MSQLDALHADQLTARLLVGDEDAFAQLFSRCRDKLWRMVNFRLDRRLIGRVDADDVLQEAYLDATQRLDHFRGSQPMSCFLWLRLVVGQTLIDVHRRHLSAQMRDAKREESPRFHSPGSASANMAFYLAASKTSPSQAAMRAEMSGLIATALDQMNTIDREVLALRHFEELSNGEVAEVLGIEQKASSIRYVRALARLKTMLTEIPGFNDNSATR